MPERTLLVPAISHGKRLDLFLAESLASVFSRSKIKKLVQEEQIKLNGNAVVAHHKVKEGDSISVEWGEREEDFTRAEDIPIEIIYEDDSLIVVNKPAGMVVHPAHGNPNHTLVNALLYHAKGLSQVGGMMRPGIVHRLDKDTSGIMVVAKNDRVHGMLAKQFKNHTIEKKYYAVVKGIVQHDEGVCEEPVGRAFINRKKVIVRPTGGKEALTFFRVLRRLKEASVLEVLPKTGRTHQIRVHMAHMDHPIIGDSLYGMISTDISRQALHAWALAFTHPVSRERLSFEAEIPEDIHALIQKLEEQG